MFISDLYKEMGGSWPKNPTVNETFRQAPLKAKGEGVQLLATLSEEPLGSDSVKGQCVVVIRWIVMLAADSGLFPEALQLTQPWASG